MKISIKHKYLVFPVSTYASEKLLTLSDGGKFYMGTVDENTCCDDDLPYMEIVANADCEIQRMELHSLKSIWS